MSRHQLRYIDKARAYCTCGRWHRIIEDWFVCNDDQRMGMMEAAFSEHCGMDVTVHVTTTVTPAALGEDTDG